MVLLLLKEIYWFAAFDTRKFPIIQLLDVLQLVAMNELRVLPEKYKD